MIGRCVYLLAAIILVVSCEDREQQAAYEVGHARDLEEQIQDIRNAIEGYQRVAETFAGTPSGRRARNRAEQLLAIEERAGALATAVGDSVYIIGTEILQAAPSYPPAMRGVSMHLYQKTRLWGRAAATRRDQNMVERVLDAWAFQDSIWSSYVFRPVPEDRKAKDLLCAHSVEVARMLEGLRRYKEALEVVTRGIEYGEDRAVLSKAKVFASFYQFRSGAFDQAIDTAEDALANEHLSANMKARANHVIGLGYTYKYQDTESIEDLDAAISALNMAIGLDPAMGDVRKLLKQLRKTKATLPS